MMTFSTPERCLIENCKSAQAVGRFLVFDKGTFRTNTEESLEWSWGLKKGSLSLDEQPRNFVFLGASLHKLYRQWKWILIPEESAVTRFFDQELLMIYGRKKFPVVKETTFNYTFQPVFDMEDIYVTRQSHENPQKVDIHEYPFDKFPTITSSIDPRYVILHAGDMMANNIVDAAVKQTLRAKYPWLSEMEELYLRWMRPIPKNASKDPTYVPPVLHDTSSSSSKSSSEAVHLQRWIAHREESVSSSSAGSVNTTAPVRSDRILPRHDVVEDKRPFYDTFDEIQGDVAELTHRALNRQNNRTDLQPAKWTTSRISSWALAIANACIPPSPKQSTKAPKKSAGRRKGMINSNYQQCLIENCKNSQAIRRFLVFDKETSFRSNIVEALEWSWGLKKGSLNLDAQPRNFIYLGASLHKLYREWKWGLIPEESSVAQFFDEELLMIHERVEFPDVKEMAFNYTFQPVFDMEEIYVTRQSQENPKHIDIHEYPFDGFPTISTTIDPKYVILHLGEMFYNGILDVSTKQRLRAKYPYLKRVEKLYVQWTQPIPKNASKDPTYVPPVIDDASSSSASSSEAIYVQRCLAQSTKSSSSLSANPISTMAPVRAERIVLRHDVVADERPFYDTFDEAYGNVAQLTQCAVNNQNNRTDLQPAKWTASRISSWALENACVPSSPSYLIEVRTEK
ncbi:hypothetical protein CVT24_001737 [Panaeolus cyanescens]|uniref:HNH nuclease domain-containing protein n=1 Tax=Panaeolus cyanescens TaxID=181874 RepID=A0A409YFR0_9AGAR|nr:hypothetical protein CVT24_001737 [Panaeolus cyanescens]